MPKYEAKQKTPNTPYDRPPKPPQPQNGEIIAKVLQWFNLSDPAVKAALYDSVVMRQFVGIDLGQELVNLNLHRGAP